MSAGAHPNVFGLHVYDNKASFFDSSSVTILPEVCV